MAKICFVNSNEAQRIVVYALAKHLVNKGNHEITIVQPARGCKLGNSFCSQMIDGLEVVPFTSFFLRSVDYNIPLLHKEINVLMKLFHDRRYDIIQASAYYYPSSIAPIIVKRKCKIPIILTSSVLPGYSWFYGKRFVDAMAKMYTFSIGKEILNSYDRIVLLYSRAIEEVEKLGVSRERLCVVPNGVDVEVFSRNPDTDQLRAKLSLRGDEKILLFVGRLAKVKRVEVLIALTKSLLEEGFKLKTLLVGDGPDRGLYERLARPIKSNVIFTGQVSHAEVAKYYSIADVFVLPSLSEGLPQVLLEASASGKPCVATRVNGTSSIIVHGETGYLVERRNIDAYHDYVQILLEDERLSKRMGSMAVQYVKENFSWEIIIAMYEKLYRDILSP